MINQKDFIIEFSIIFKNATCWKEIRQVYVRLGK